MGNLSSVVSPTQLDFSEVDAFLRSFNTTRFGDAFVITREQGGWTFALPELDCPVWDLWELDDSLGVEGKHPRPGASWAYWAWDEFHNALAREWGGVNRDDGTGDEWLGVPPRKFEDYAADMCHMPNPAELSMPASLRAYADIA